MASNLGQIAVFPSQAVSDSEKKSQAYGLKVGRAIKDEWYRRDSGYGRFQQQQVEFHRLRKYARGEQSTQIYKDLLSIDGDLSYINLDWTPVHILPKFVDVIVNGMQDRLFKIKAFAQDPAATEKRTKFVKGVERDMLANDILKSVESKLGIQARNVPEESLPTDTEELELYMQLGYKQGIEIAIEQAVDNVFLSNKYHNIKRRVDSDITILGMGATKCTFNGTDGIKLDWVDPADLVYSYTEDPHFEDCYYFGEVKRVRIHELKKEFPSLTKSEIEEIVKNSGQTYDYTPTNFDYQEDSYDTNTVDIMYYCWRTWENNVHKVKETSSGGKKAIPKGDGFNPPKDERARYQKVAQVQEVIYEGVITVGSEQILKWEKAKNMMRPDSNANKVIMPYAVCAPKLYKGKIESLVNRMTTYADQIQLTHLKLQQAIQRMVPSGIYLDADGLAEIDLGNGTSYSPKEALNMYFQTGSIIGRSLTSEGDQNPGKIPIQELPGGGGGQVELLINAYNYYLNMIRDVSGINEARDGGDPDPYSLVGVQKLAAANSNTATRHILHGSMAITSQIAECIVVRFKDVTEFHPQKEKFIGSIGKFSVGSLEELDKMHMHDFGIFLELEPDEEEKQLLEANIQAALAQQSVELEDAIDIRQIRNVKLANQMLKYRRVRKRAADQEEQQANIKAQSEANSQASQAAEQAKAQAEQVKNESKIQVATAESELAIKMLQVEKTVKKELMQFEFSLNVELKQMDLAQQRRMGADKNSANLEGKKMSLDSPPKGAKPTKGFESKGNDVLGSIDFAKYDPK